MKCINVHTTALIAGKGGAGTDRSAKGESRVGGRGALPPIGFAHHEDGPFFAPINAKYYQMKNDREILREPSEENYSFA